MADAPGWGGSSVLDPVRVGRRRWLGQLVVASVVPAMLTAGGASRAVAEVGRAAPVNASVGPDSEAGSARPNIVVILTDDQRRDDLGRMPTCRRCWLVTARPSTTASW